MVSDVPLGSFLSGGIDSSAIVAFMRPMTGPVTTYTIGFKAEDLRHEIVPDDVLYSRRVGRQFQTDYHEEILDPAVTTLLPKLVWHMDEPIADPACISTYLICAAAQSRLTVDPERHGWGRNLRGVSPPPRCAYRSGTRRDAAGGPC